MWALPEIADAVQAGVHRAAAAFDEEQAVAGLDARDEVSLHPMLEEALIAAGYGVFREERYPADWTRPRGSEGERCDLVLTPERRELRVPERRATLFDAPDAVDLDEAFWLEVKVVAQYTPEGANAGYSGQLLSTVRQDVTKLSKDHGILHAALLIVLFVAEPAVAEHDLGIWQDRCLERGLPIGAPCVRTVPITDRLGNQVCSIALYPVSHY